MWILGETCPRFRVRTARGIVGPESLTGHWLILIHCSKPCVLGCSACTDCFDTVADQLTVEHCRLVVALDAPDANSRTEILALETGAQSPWQMGVWEYPERPTGDATRVAVVDPEGVIRALLEVPNHAPLTAILLMDLLRRAQRQSLEIDDNPSPRPVRECVGCVDWFDFDVLHRH